MPEEILVGLCIIPLVAIPFIFFAFLRWLRYRETIALAEKGLLYPSHQHNGRDTLRWGIVILALGLALTCGLYPLGWAGGSNFLFYFGPWMLIGLLPTALGLALIIIYRVTRDEKDNAENGPGGAAGGGSGGAGVAPAGSTATAASGASPVPPGWGEAQWSTGSEPAPGQDPATGLGPAPETDPE